MKKIMFLFMFVLLSSFISATIDWQEEAMFYYHNQSDGSVFIDEAGRRNATITGNASNCGGFYCFDGGDYISVDNHVEIADTSGYTMSLWYEYSVDHVGVLFSETDLGGQNDNIRLQTQTALDDLIFINFDDPTAQTITSDTGGLINDGWHNIMIIRNSTDNKQYMYLDGVSEGTPFEDTLTIANQWQGFGTRLKGTPTLQYDGHMMSMTIINRTLTQLEITNLFSQGEIYNPFADINTPPIITTILPTNHNHSSDVPTAIQFNVSDDESDLVNISLWVNNSNVYTLINRNVSTDNLFQYNHTGGDGNVTWFVEADDGIANVNSSNMSFILDTIIPVWTIRTINTANSTKFDRLAQNWIFWNDTLTDTYVFAYNVTVKYPNGSIWFTNQSINLNVSEFNYTRNITIDTGQANGTYSVNYYGEDDHTAKEIPTYTHGIDEDGLSYFFDDYYIQIKTDNPQTLQEISTTKLLDRYTFNFEYRTPRNIRYYSLYSDTNIYYRGDLYDYPVFVIGKNWVDFNFDEQGTTYRVMKRHNNWYQIEVTKINPSNFDEIRSLGGLNIVNETYTFIISENEAPNITAVNPVNQSFNINDGTQLYFSVNATDPDNDTLTYEYYFDDALVNSTQNWTWIVPFNNHGIHNMTVYAIDQAGKNDSFMWTINITNLNVAINITLISRTPTTTWYSNILNTYFTCAGIDGDNETQPANWTVQIDYRTNIAWSSLTPAFLSGNTWRASINISTFTGESLDVRCRADDGFGFSDYLQANNLVIIQGAYVPVGNVSKVSPSGVNRDFVTSVTCDTSSFGTIPSYQIRYDIDAYYDSSWHNISYNFFNKALFDMTNIDYNENVSFRCRTTDGITTTNFTQGLDVTRQHITNLFMFDRGNDEVQKAHKPYYKGLFVDMHDEIGVSIISTYADCNGDGFWDYYFTYNDTRNTTKEHFLCYNTKGIIKHTIGVFINKSNSSNILCGVGNTGICKIERNYDVIVK